jgi:hypothetical protein
MGERVGRGDCTECLRCARVARARMLLVKDVIGVRALGTDVAWKSERS